MEQEQLKPIIEAAVLASSQPMTLQQLDGLFVEEDNVGLDDISRVLESLRQDCDGRGIELVEVASGFRYQVRQREHAFISRLWTEKPSRYSRALLETLSLIAYRQPITRPEIEQIRGVVVSSSIIKTLEEREWIRVVGYRDVPGKPALFGTTRIFLDYFNLKSLDALPPLSEIRDMEDLNPQMRLDGEERALPGLASGDEATQAQAGEPASLPLVESTANEAADSPDADTTHDGQPRAAADAMHNDALADMPAADTDEPADDIASASPTADEAETADVDDDAAPQDTEEYRA